MMENISVMVRRIERSVYLTISAVMVRNSENGDIGNWLKSHDIMKKCTGLPPLPQHMKPQA